ncbi:hypothetical protein PCI56_01850 [Plesiomonas shigelloides subsp. oncorhynchi]|nr:hypothetical protein [Plesiomonas shigelloides]
MAADAEKSASYSHHPDAKAAGSVGGDISTLTWSDDYQAQADGRETVTPPQGSAVATERLKLTAKTPALAIRRSRCG